MRRPLFTFINVSGLSIGIACAVFTFLYVKSELGYDRFHANAGNIYRVNSIQKNSGETALVATTPPPLAATLRKDFAEVKHTVRVGRWWANFKSEAQVFEEKSIYAVDPSFLSVFSFPLLKGTREQALLRPDAILITEQTAEKYFGQGWQNKSVVGKQLSAKAGKDEYTFTITGVLSNIPVQSTLQFDFLVPFAFLEKFDNATEQWGYYSYYTFVQTAAGTDEARFAEKVKAQIATYRPGSETTLQLQQLTNIYLNSNVAYNSELGVVGNRSYVNIFITTGILILLLACINFINLSTAQTVPRSKEVGLRKTIGASRVQLVSQFLFEAAILCGAAVLLAFLLVELAFPLFSTLYGKPIRQDYDASFCMGLAVLYLATVLLAGSYPAFYLSSFKPVKVLKGVIVAPRRHRFRQALILTQFVVAVVMIIAAIVVASQLRYLRTKNLGFNRSQLLYVRLKAPDIKKNYRLFKSDIQQQADVAGITASTANMVDVSNSSNGIKWEGMQPGDDFLMTQMTVDADFLKTTGIALLEGRNFSSEVAADSAAYLVNKTAAERLGMWKNAIGKKLTFWGTEGTIIGILKDFNYQALTTSIQPMVFGTAPKSGTSTSWLKQSPARLLLPLHVLNVYTKNTIPSRLLNMALSTRRLTSSTIRNKEPLKSLPVLPCLQ
ncbi:ABC transporter permease [Segetibacter sp. 3557_3]|uniref:ABC transporter permease n=1 Tax=Segetibacter sp. 3557_3 TaxID=2547429 RepID=UPI00105860F6|nr:ABC transporter permease [Segetibacter sp. 3557_3]TDH26892.1 ABC transporter permease [Segetibacter sp. 3557_3]